MVGNTKRLTLQKLVEEFWRKRSFIITFKKVTQSTKIMTTSREAFLKSTCVRFDYRNGGGASGFHLGNGWIVTNSHVAVKGTHSSHNNSEVSYLNLISQAEITITISDNAETIKLVNECSIVVFTKISAGRFADFTQGDLALIHVPRIKDCPAVSVGLLAAIGVDSVGVTSSAGDLCTTYHFGWAGGNRPSALLTSENESNGNIGNHHFERTTTCVGGSSGSPVFSSNLTTLLGVTEICMYPTLPQKLPKVTPKNKRYPGNGSVLPKNGLHR